MYDLVTLNDVYDVQITSIAYNDHTAVTMFNIYLGCCCERRELGDIALNMDRCVMHHFR
jgi:hypothetical protein